MGKKDLMKSAIAVLVIIVLAVLIVNVDKIITPKVPSVVDEGVNLGTGDAKIGNEAIEGCFSESPDTVVFVYSNSCPYCNKMKPFVNELEDEGYKFYWAEGSDSEAREVITNCFSDLLGKYVPQFICPATGKEQTGAMSKDELKKFADDCR